MKATVPEVQALITECNGNVAAIARRLRVSRAYIYKRINEAPKLRDAIADAREAMLDNVESALYKQVLEGNTTAMIFWLKTQGKRRGWVERQEVTGPDGGPIAHVSKSELDHEIDRLLEEMAAREEAGTEGPAEGESIRLGDASPSEAVSS